MDKPFKVLIIDDEPDVLEYLEELISDAGYDVVCLPHGNDVMAAMKEHHDELCLVICDYNMPGKTGLEVREELKADYNGIPFIIHSSEVTREMLETALELNIATFIDKPASIELLLESIEKYSKERRDVLEEKAFLKKIFIEEAAELVAELEPLILELEQNPDETDGVNSIFRLVHTIKGGSGVLDRPEVTAFVHSYEDLLGKIKNGSIKAEPEVVSVLLAGFDELSAVVAGMADKEPEAIDLGYWKAQFELKEASSSTAGKSASRPSKPGGEKKPSGEKKPKDQENIKVPTAILNEFMELSGEITVIRNTVNKLVLAIKKEIKGNTDLRLLAEMIEEMNKINSTMQTKITEIRKIPIQNVFRTFPRVVRDISSKGGKEIELVMAGESLRIDTTLHQVLSNSLIHIIRNACDHGIEPCADRKSAGKPSHGTIRLEASESGEFIQIMVKDDGRGIDAEKIKASALKKNLYSEPELAAMSDAQAFQIIFESGFSTASQVTDISGRGVGMDMVKTSVESIGGKIFIESTIGEGSQFTFRLPIPRSVLIIKSLTVENSGHPYFIAQDGISRIIKVDESNVDRLVREVSGSKVIQTTDQLLPLVCLREILGQEPSAENARDFHVLIVKGEDFHYGIAVDKIIDSEEVVVKTLAPYLKKIGTYLGATFLGDGRIGIVLDVCGIAKKYGIERSTGAELEMIRKPKTTEKAEEDVAHLLVVSLFSEGIFAFDLSAVFRLEQINVQDVRQIAGHNTFIYRGVATEIVDLTKQLSLNEDHDIFANDLLQTVVVKRGERFVALVIDSIKEIIELNPDRFQDEPEQGFIAGNQVEGDKLICVLDIKAILRSIDPKSSVENEAAAPAVPNREEHAKVTDITTKRAKTDAAESGGDIDMAAGWGEF